jgi:AcrR family transcriptional regulator
VAAAGRLFRHGGYAGTGIKAILTESAAPYGSLYHFFPGGKQQLGVATLAAGGEMYRDLVVEHFDNERPVVECVQHFFAGAAALLEATDFEDACPVATIALEVANTNAAMREASAVAFGSWINVLEQRVARDGLPTDDAHRIAVQLFCAIEGAFLLARTLRSTAPVLLAGEGVAESLTAAFSCPVRATGCQSGA